MPILQIIDMMRNEIIRRLGILLVLSLLTLGAAAQGEHPFNPQKFEADGAIHYHLCGADSFGGFRLFSPVPGDAEETTSSLPQDASIPAYRHLG